MPWLTNSSIVAIAAIRVHGFRTETLFNNHRLAFLESLELHLGMISACLPFLGPPLAKIRDLVFGICSGPPWDLCCEELFTISIDDIEMYCSIGASRCGSITVIRLYEIPGYHALLLRSERSERSNTDRGGPKIRTFALALSCGFLLAESLHADSLNLSQSAREVPRSYWPKNRDSSDSIGFRFVFYN